VKNLLLLLSCLVCLNASGCTKSGSAGATGKENSKTGRTEEEMSLDGKKFIVIANSMVYYGGLVQQGDQKKEDPGMLSRILKEHHGNRLSVTDCTSGGHHLCDFLDKCRMEDKSCFGTDHLSSLNLSSFDYVIISEAGNNYSHFYSDAVSVFNRFKTLNPNVKLYYINHIYSVYKEHDNVLGNLKTLHDQMGVTIVNCGQLAYDLYKGKVKATVSSSYPNGHYDFTNHTSSDTYHPNPLMGYIMTQMVYCAITGESAEGEDYLTLVKNCKYAGGGVSYEDYYGKYYTHGDSSFREILNNRQEMAGIQKLIPQYINKY